MRQALHIFRKDTECFTLHIAVVAVCCAAGVVLDLLRPESTTVLFILRFALILAWWFTIALVLQEENPTGDRQFWVTRPYAWKSLVIAKVMFALAFLILPMALADCVVLAGKGFSPLAFAGGILKHQLFLSLILVPPLAIAAATRDIRQFILAVLGSIIAISAIGGGQSSIMASDLVETLRPGWLRQAMFVIELWPVQLLAVLIWQFAFRRTMITRILLFAIAAACYGYNRWPPGESAIALEHQVPAPAGRFAAVGIRFDVGRPHPPGRIVYGDSRIQVDVPVGLSGWTAELLEVEPVSAAISAEHSVVWRGEPNVLTLRTDHNGRQWLHLRLDESDLTRIGERSIELRAEFGIGIYEPEGEARFPWSAVEAQDPWHRVGQVLVRSLYGPGPWRSLRVRIPVGSTEGRWTYSLEDPDGRVRFSDATANFGSPIEIGPVREMTLPWSADDRGITVDPESVVVIRRARRVGLVRRDLVIPGIRLQDYLQ